MPTAPLVNTTAAVTTAATFIFAQNIALIAPSAIATTVFPAAAPAAASCGTATQCTLLVDSTKAVSAVFDLAGPHTLLLTKVSNGGGRGSVTSSDGTIDCSPGCGQIQHVYQTPVQVTLSASASQGSTFSGFTGACGTLVPVCVLTMDHDQDVSATFTGPNFEVRVTKTGAAPSAGTVVSRDGKINCGGTCSASYAPGSTLALAASVVQGYQFTLWGGDAASCKNQPTCTLTVDGPKNVLAQFDPIILLVKPPAVATAGGLRWTSDLSAAGATARVLVNGDQLVVASSGRSEYVLRPGPRDNRVEARLVEAGGAGSWRFELESGATEPGSLRVLQGDVALVTDDSIVFRLSGRPGEAVAFTFRTRGTE